MGKIAQKIIKWLPRNQISANPFFDAISAGNSSHVFDYSVRSGEVVLEQFHPWGDLHNKVVLDYGCGHGGKTIAYARQGVRKTIGIDQLDHFQLAREYAGKEGLSVDFMVMAPNKAIPLPDQSVDVLISSSVLEHVADVGGAFQEMCRVLRKGGLMLLRWQPFRTRYGVHLQEVFSFPFVHLLFKEADVVKSYMDIIGQRQKQVDAYAEYVGFSIKPVPKTYDDLTLHLNRFTIAKMQKTMKHHPVKPIDRKYYWGTHGRPWVARLPISCRELFCDYELLILRKTV